MCGFNGVFGNNIINNISIKNSFPKMGEMSFSRGPDDHYSKFLDHCFLHFNRLSILDLTESGRQPKVSKNGKWNLVFNGEIYNHLEIRNKLKNKEDIVSHSDSETLIHAINELGLIETVKMLNGMFAIAAYDKENNELWLIRDFAGIKPLYFGTSKTGLTWFASQFDQVVYGISRTEDIELNASGMRDYLQLGYMQAPKTIYNQIEQVLPGEIVKISIENKIEKIQYLSFPQTSLNNEEHKNEKDEFYQTMTQSVSDQMLSDVPLGAFLSSGIDSPLVSAFAGKINKSIKTYTVGLVGFDGDEREGAKEYADILGLENCSLTIDPKALEDAIQKSIQYQTEPFGDYSSIPTYLITQKAREYNTVMLSGDGGDELFWGYPRWNTYLKEYNRYKYPMIVRKIETYLSKKMGRKKSYGPSSLSSPGEWVLEGQSHNKLDFMNALMPNSTNTSELKNLFAFEYGKSKEEFRNWLRWNEFYGHLQRVLVKVDRMSMANSLEVRVPFLDKRIIEFAWNLKSNYGKVDFENKKFLKEILYTFISKEKVNKKKIGFSVPIDQWLKGILAEDVKKLLLHTPFYGEKYINKSELHNYINDYYNGKHSKSWGVWILYCWQKWGLSVNNIVKE